MDIEKSRSRYERWQIEKYLVTSNGGDETTLPTITSSKLKGKNESSGSSSIEIPNPDVVTPNKNIVRKLNCDGKRDVYNISFDGGRKIHSATILISCTQNGIQVMY